MVALMREELIGPDGAIVAGQNAEQLRLAMNSLLNRARVVHDGLGDEEDGEVDVIGIRINMPGSGG